MTDTVNLEDRLATELDRQNIKLTPATFRELLTPIIGRMDASDFIKLEVGSISLADYVRTSCATCQDNSETSETTGNLTERMRQEIAESRSRSLPSDWTTVRNRCAGLTAQYMDEIAGERQN